MAVRHLQKRNVASNCLTFIIMNRVRSITLHPQEDIHCPASAILRKLRGHCREGKTDPNLAIVNTAADLQKAAGRPSFLSDDLRYEQLEAAERSLPDVGHRYVVVYRNGNPIMIAVFQLYTLTARSFNLHKDRSFVRHILAMFLNLRRARVLIAGNALRTDSTCFCYDHTQVSNKEAYETLATIAEQIGEKEDASAIILTGMGKAGTEAAKALSGMGFIMPWEDNVMEMNIDSSWQSFEDYVESLTRKYRSRANKIVAAAASIEVVQMSTEMVRRYRSDIEKLFRNVIEKQEFVLTASGASYIAALKELYDENFEVTGFFDGKKLVAFSSAFVGNDDYEVFYVGFDNDANNTHQLYFNILFRSLERSVLLRKKILKLGRTSFDAKASLGARAKARNYLVKLHHVPDRALKWFVDYFSSLEDSRWKLRDPLKSRSVAS